MSPAVVPLFAFIVTALCCWYFGFTISTTDPASLISIGGTIASVGATMLGFLLATMAVLASINHTHLVNMMRKTGHYSDLLGTIFYGCIAFLLCTAVGFVLVFGIIPPSWLRMITVALHVAAFTSLVDVGRKFWLVLSNLRSA